MRGDLPLDLGRQAPAGPAAPGVGLVPVDVHRRLRHRHPHELAEAVLQHALAHLLDMARRAPAFLQQPEPAFACSSAAARRSRRPRRTRSTAPRSPACASISNSGSATSCRPRSLSNVKPAPRAAAEAPARRRQTSSGSRSRVGGQLRGSRLDVEAERLRHDRKRLAVHVLVEQREAIEVQRVVVGIVGRGVEQLERRLERLDAGTAASPRGRAGQPPAAVVRHVRRVVPAVGVRLDRRQPGGVGSRARRAWRCRLRAIQYSWNQPMWPSSQSGGFSSAICGTRARRRRALARRRRTSATYDCAHPSARATAPPARRCACAPLPRSVPRCRASHVAQPRVILIVSPALAAANNGNWHTAARWARHAAKPLSHRHRAALGAASRSDLLIALHARRCAASIAAWPRRIRNAAASSC